MKKKNEWRHGLKVGDLVMMKHGGMALITNVRRHTDEWFVDEARNPPHIEMIYCDDGESGSCSSYRIERLINESR